MTEKLFETDSFLYEAEGQVLTCDKSEKGFEITLDQTVFFPEGGGQPGDQGTLSEVRVLDTYYKDGTIIHLCIAPLEPGRIVNERLDRDRRLDHIQQHTGEHILSFAFWKLFGAVNVGFHMNETSATIDMDREISREQLYEAEKFSNHQIYLNLPIRVYQTTLSQLKNKKMRKISAKAGDRPRVVEIEQGDICTCCGTHANFTGTVGIIKIIRTEKMRSGMRIEFLCGGRALRFFGEQNDLAKRLMSELSTDFKETPQRVKTLKEELAALKGTLREKSEALAEYKAKALLSQVENGFVLATEQGLSVSEARSLLNRLMAKGCEAAAVIFTGKGRVQYLCAAAKSGKYDCLFLCDLLNGLYGGKGGGSCEFAQGSGNFSDDWEQRAALFRQSLSNL